MPASVFTQRQILFFWLPLAASWALMSAEGPILQAVIARLPDLQTQLAAFGIVMSLEIAIESPVIMLLATSTALATTGPNFRVLRRFMIWISVLTTVVAILVAFTPVYDLIVLQMMGIPGPIAAAAQPGMKIMTLWSAAIGLRRFLQGVLIRTGETRWIGVGTITRLASSGGGGILLAWLTPLPGVCIASLALMAGVMVEALFVMYASRPTVRRILSPEKSETARELTLRQVTLYHLPLAATSLLTLLAQPIIGAGLARMPNPVESLAAWPVIWGILFLSRSPAFALPEAVLALVSERRLRLQVRIFCHRIGLTSTTALATLVLTPLLGMYLRHVAGLPPRLSMFVVPALILALAIPYVNSIHSWFRGILMHESRTKDIYRGMGLNLAVTALVILAGAALDTPGCETAVLALTIALLAELYYLRRRSRIERMVS
jgi:hypothetical protein